MGPVWLSAWRRSSHGLSALAVACLQESQHSVRTTSKRDVSVLQAKDMVFRDGVGVCSGPTYKSIESLVRGIIGVAAREPVETLQPAHCLYELLDGSFKATKELSQDLAI